MRTELFEPGGCSAWPTSACAIATMRAAGELPAGAAAGATAPAALGAGAPVGVAVTVGPVTEAVRSICAKSSDEGVAVVVVVVGGGAVAGAVGPVSSVFSCAIRAKAVSRLISLSLIGPAAGTLDPCVEAQRGLTTTGGRMAAGPRRSGPSLKGPGDVRPCLTEQ